MGPKRQRPSLRNALDRDVYNVVRKLHDDDVAAGELPGQLTVADVYDTIKRSNSSLARLKRRPLEEAVERALEVHNEEVLVDDAADDSEAMAEELAALAEREAREARDASLLNRQMTKHWDVQRNAAGAEGPPNGEPKAKRVKGSAAEREGRKEKRHKSRDRSPSSGLSGSTALKVKDRSAPTGITIRDVAGLDGVLQELLGLVWEPLRRGLNMADMGLPRPDGVLLYGPSGCGKTMLVNAVAASLGVSYIPVSCASVIGGLSGESERNLRALFDEAIALAPCLLFLDEIDAITGKREQAAKAMESRVISELGNCMDRLGRETSPGKYVVLVAASNTPDSIEPVVRRRFGSEIALGMPNEKARESILRAMTKDTKLAPDVDFAALAKLTPGWVGADLRHVVNAAGRAACESSRLRLVEQALAAADGPTDRAVSGADMWELLSAAPGEAAGDAVAFSHFRAAVKTVQPAAKREGFSTIPDTTWAHVGAMADVRARLEATVVGPITNPALYARAGFRPTAGILLWGPPGCGKTLVAKAVASASRANFIAIKGPELLNKWVGESERAVRALFARARAMPPCILFFDEMDALAPRRADGAAEHSARVVNALLTELDGVGDRDGVFVVAATNRPDIIDPAVRRPGRLGTSVFVGLPGPRERVDILRALHRKAAAAAAAAEGDGDGAAGGASAESPATADLLERVALDDRCTGFSGADLSSLLQAAGLSAIKRALKDGSTEPVIVESDWESALGEVKPSVTDIHRYDDLAE